MEGHAVGRRHFPEILVVGNDRGDVDAEVPGAVAVQQVVEAMAVLGNQDDNLRLGLGVVDLPSHGESPGELAELQPQAG